MSRVALTALAVCSSLACDEAEIRPETSQPKIIAFISLDTIRADHLSVYGYERPTTPFLKTIAAGGTRFESVITTMPTTDPAHLSMFTGLYPRTHGVRRNGVPLTDPKLPNLASWVRDLGYDTAAFVSRKHLQPSALGLAGFDSEDGPNRAERVGEETVRRALEWVRQPERERLFVWLHLFDPHFPYEPPEPFLSRFGESESSRPIVRSRQVPSLLPDGYMQTQIDRYDGEIAFTDGLVEKFVSDLQSLAPEDDPPLIIVVGDHGESLDELWERFGVAFVHGQSLHQGQLTVPLLFWWPGRVPGESVQASTASLVDIAPTLFALLSGQGFPTQGVNLFHGLDEPIPRLVFSERRVRVGRDRKKKNRLPPAQTQLYSVQDERYKLVLSISGEDETTELYDLLLDSLEERDISSIDMVNHDRLLAEMQGWLDATPAARTSAEIPEEKREALKALGYLD